MPPVKTVFSLIFVVFLGIFAAFLSMKFFNHARNSEKVESLAGNLSQGLNSNVEQSSLASPASRSSRIKSTEESTFEAKTLSQSNDAKSGIGEKKSRSSKSTSKTTAQKPAKTKLDSKWYPTRVEVQSVKAEPTCVGAQCRLDRPQSRDFLLAGVALPLGQKSGGVTGRSLLKRGDGYTQPYNSLQ